MENQVEKQYDLRQRHGFTTFWLWLGAITNAIAIIVYIVMAVEAGKVHNSVETVNTITYGVSNASGGGLVSSAATYLLISSIFGILFAIANIWGNYLMLNWKKKGFYVRLIVLALNIVLSFIIAAATSSFSAAMGYLLAGIFGSLIGIAVLYAILNLRKNDKSCWELMD